MSAGPSVLMCPPDHFEVAYEINPWMAAKRPVDKALAQAQWSRLRDRLAELADVETMTPQPGLPDMVFTANAGAASPRCVVPSHFMPHERRPEEAHFKAWFRNRGFTVKELPDDVGFEGEGDCLADTRVNGLYWAAYGFRTELQSHDALARWFDAEIVSLRLVDPRFYHLDTCLTPLAFGHLMYFPDAFDEAGRDAIRARVPEPFRIKVSEYDACRFACNAVNIGERIFLNAASRELLQRLESAGYVVETVELSEFVKAGGAAKCLVLQLPG